MKSPELIWEGELDSGYRAGELVADLQTNAHPEGVMVALNASHVLVEIPTRSFWGLVTWTVSAIMIWLGLTSDNWFLLIFVPFMMAGAIMQSFGHVSILMRDEQVSVFEGVGGIGRRRNMSLRAIQRVEYAVKRGRGGATAWIVLKGAGRKMKFGRHLSDEQVRFVMAVLLDTIRSLGS